MRPRTIHDTDYRTTASSPTASNIGHCTVAGEKLPRHVIDTSTSGWRIEVPTFGLQVQTPYCHQLSQSRRRQGPYTGELLASLAMYDGRRLGHDCAQPRPAEFAQHGRDRRSYRKQQWGLVSEVNIAEESSPRSLATVKLAARRSRAGRRLSKALRAAKKKKLQETERPAETTASGSTYMQHPRTICHTSSASPKYVSFLVHHVLTSVRHGSSLLSAIFLRPSLCRSRASSFRTSRGTSRGSELGPSGWGSGLMSNFAMGSRSS